MKTKLYAPVLVAGIVLLSVSGAMAKPNPQTGHNPETAKTERGDMACPGMSPDKQEAIKGIMKEYRTAIGPLQDQFDAKRYELDALSRNPNTKPEMISKVSAELGSMMSQIRTVKEKRDNRMEAEVGFIPGKKQHKGRGMSECMGMGGGHKMMYNHGMAHSPEMANSPEMGNTAETAKP